jgi:hypothetical protein
MEDVWLTKSVEEFDRKIPSPKLQTPRNPKLQIPKQTRRAAWLLNIGASLVLGALDLGF